MLGPCRSGMLPTMALRKVLLGPAVAAGLAALYFRVLRDRHLNWNATPAEAAGTLPGDELLPHADLVATRVVEIAAPPSAVWPWLVQMGPGRAGAYTYDWLERRLGVDIHNTNRIVPELQHMEVGDEVPMGSYSMRAEIVEPERTLAFASSDGRWVWSFELVPVDGHTRLLSRNRFDSSRFGVRDRLGYVVIEPGSWVMERKMLLTIKRLAEELARDDVES
jgi:hypothetical protein